MRIADLRRSRPVDGALPGVIGSVRLDRRTAELAKRLRPGEIAVIDHLDLDRVAAEALVRSGAAAVLNAAPSISGRYPTLGPDVLLAAGIPLLDEVGPDLFAGVREGTLVRIHEGTVYDADGRALADGTVQTADSVAAATARARTGLAVQLEAFAANTAEYLHRERDLLLDGVGVPDITTAIEGRHVLVVVRGYDYREELRALRSYIREWHPVLVGVDGGADALLEAGLKPDLVIGDLESVSDAALRCGAEVVAHTDGAGASPGLGRVHELGVTPAVFASAGTSEDLALLLADSKGAALIVAVGTQATLVEFLDKGRVGMASTFLTRLRIGGKLVDAKSVSRLHRSRIGMGSVALLLLATAAAFVLAAAVLPGARRFREIYITDWHHVVHWVRGLFS
jgi:uncharacterized membrane-anchored protein